LSLGHPLPPELALSVHTGYLGAKLGASQWGGEEEPSSLEGRSKDGSSLIDSFWHKWREHMVGRIFTLALF
jgi:hypothetical protein